MKINFSKLKLYLNILRKIKVKIEFLKQSKILIFDKRGSSSYIYKDIVKENYNIICVLGEEINLIILARLIFKLKFPNLKNYINEYIKNVKPSFILHNSFNKNFFKINPKDFNFKFKRIFTQSEMRNRVDHEHTFGKNKFYCDYLLVWSSSMKNLMSKNVTGKYIITGSYRNNMGPKINKHNFENKLSFVSQFRPFKPIVKTITKNTKLNYYPVPMKFSYNDFFNRYLILAKKLKNFCVKENIKFEIVGAAVDKINIDDEIIFFEKCLGKKNWKFIQSAKNKRGHYLTDKSKYVVTMDSTLGYECFARGQRVAFFSTLPSFLRFDYGKFGWPLNVENEGPFWTTQNSDQDFIRVTDFLINGSENDWDKLRKKYEKILHYDFENKKFNNFFKNLNLINE